MRAGWAGRGGAGDPEDNTGVGALDRKLRCCFSTWPRGVCQCALYQSPYDSSRIRTRFASVDAVPMESPAEVVVGGGQRDARLFSV